MPLVPALGTRRVFVAFDNDDAGRLGAGKVVAALTQAGVDARAVHPPDPYKDLSAWAAAEGAREVIAEVSWSA